MTPPPHPAREGDLQMFVDFSVLPPRAATLLGLLTGAFGSVALAVILAEHLPAGIRDGSPRAAA